MASQPAAPRVRNTDRLFLALLPDQAALERIVLLGAALRSELALTGTPVPPERLHVTLHFLGDHPGLPQPLFQAAGEVAATVAGATAAFQLAFDSAASFERPRGPSPFVLRGDRQTGRLMSFQRALGDGMAAAGLAHRPPQPYTPHLTLLYDRKQVPMRGITPAIGWTARDVVLVRSRIGRGSHEVLARWTLRPAP